MSEALTQNNSAPLTEAETALARKRLNQLWKRGTDFLGTQYAILGGAMSWVSERH
ncbi:MAG: 2-nitropropane dioxygenase, partial [Acetobacter orientalis]